jgi:hypothetical protein
MKALQWILGLVLVLLTASVLIRTFAQTHQDADEDEDQEEAVQAPSHVSVINGRTVVTLDALTRKRAGIAVETLHEAELQRQAAAAATVLPVQDLATMRAALVSDLANIGKAQVAVDASRKEYGRLRALFEQNQNASQKSVEMAEAAVNTNRAALQEAQQELEVQKMASAESWGSVVAEWIAAGKPQLDRVLRHQELLVEVTLQPDHPSAAPRSVALSAPGGHLVPAKYLSPYPRVDPRIQGISLLYQAGAYPGLEPGMNLVAHLAAGARVKGVLLPRSAIVWWQGQAWVYVQTARAQFSREPVSTSDPVAAGYFETDGLKPGVRVVTRGAEELLTEEFRSQIQPED